MTLTLGASEMRESPVFTKLDARDHNYRILLKIGHGKWMLKRALCFIAPCADSNCRREYIDEHLARCNSLTKFGDGYPDIPFPKSATTLYKEHPSLPSPPMECRHLEQLSFNSGDFVNHTSHSSSSLRPPSLQNYMIRISKRYS